MAPHSSLTASPSLLAPAVADLDQRCVTTVRLLAADAVERAGSGHPGLPMGAAPMAWVLWSRFLHFDPSEPKWPDRDRFVLSAGHGSMLHYALLHLCGYDLPMSELQAFRQWGSLTPGHPEYGHTPGIETTTGPLGQGFANAVGMALAEQMMAARYNRDGSPTVVNHRTFVVCSDGDLMEGVSSEAASLAGHLGLGRLVVLYDDNHISIDGPTDLAFSEDVAARFAAYHWHVQAVEDGNDLDAIETAIDLALAVDDKPSLICVRTRIGFGAPTKEGTADVHGAPLGAAELAACKAGFGWPEEDTFVVPPDVRDRCGEAAAIGRERRQTWRQRLESWRQEHPSLAEEWQRVIDGRLPALSLSPLEGPSMATRVASGKALCELAGQVPELVGGSADLTDSTNVRFSPDAVGPGSFGGRQLHFGVREHAMAAVLNGLSLHGGFRVFGSTFLIFSDYLRPALRLSALMGQPVIYVLTHDSIGLGEDGPTHQPVEHLAALRAIPNVAVIRPADANETVEAWQFALERRDGPTVLALTRQSLPVLARSQPGWLADFGARVVVFSRAPDVVLIGTGSEVALCINAAARLGTDHGVAAQVVSMPWRERFCRLEQAAQDGMLPTGVPRLVVEAGVRQGWEQIATTHCLDRFGASAPGPVVMKHLGLSVDSVVDAAMRLV
jgi:transketolase